MKGVELYGRVRYAVQIEGLSRREAARPRLTRVLQRVIHASLISGQIHE